MIPHPPKRPLLWSDWVYDLQEITIAINVAIYIVGGAVRDAYLHRPIKDIDLTTSGSARDLARQIANHFKGDVFVMDAERDVARVLIDTPTGKLNIDVAGFRGTTLLADLQDRDFTINAIVVDLKGDLTQVIDPLNGEGDLINKRLRLCAPTALSNDPLRVLRGIRQSVQLSFRLAPETLTEIRLQAPRLIYTSGERIRDEFFKILALSRPTSALRIADKIGVLPLIVPEIPASREAVLLLVDKLNTLFSALSFTRSDNTAANFEFGMLVMQLDRYRVALNQRMDTHYPEQRNHRAVLMLAALLYQADESSQRLEDLRLSNAERHVISTVIAHQDHPIFREPLTPLAIHRFWYPLDQTGVDVCLFATARYLMLQHTELKQDQWLLWVQRLRTLFEAYFERYEQVVRPPMLVDGHQLKLALQLKSGKIIGQLLTAIREAQAQGLITTSDEAMLLARSYLEDHR
ncbi:MAG: hypothetical protein MUF87_04505 [Anaerolineae bacterium]|jgi:tRNA nucleotidyltransferase/poly(A) polymerase|nr:hypothetical protein [Anaerolineae bacterium]